MIDKLNNRYCVSGLASVYEDSESYSYQGLLSKQASKINEIVEELNNKVTQGGDFTGSWHGVSNPAMSEPGIQGQVLKNIEDIKTIEKRYNTVFVQDFATLENAIDYANKNKCVLELEPKEYFLANGVTLDLSRMSLKGNGAVINFSKAPINTTCFTIIASNVKPYMQNANFIEKIEFIGRGKTSLQKCIEFASDNSNRATSHLNLTGLNIHEFGIGINFKSFVYMIRTVNTDIYETDKCVVMPDGGQDYGENINFYGCCFYNSNIGLYGRNPNGSFHLTSCSIDYCDIFTDIENGNKLFFNNGHMEGQGSIKGDNNINDSWIVLLPSKPYVFDTTNGSIKLDNCFINSNRTYGNLVKGDGAVRFDNCRHYNISDIVTNKLNEKSSVISPKAIDLYAIEGTGEPTDIWNRKNCVITKDSRVKETGDYAYKINKEYGVGSASKVSILIKRKNKNNKRVHFRLRVKGSKVISASESDFNFHTIQLSQGNIKGMPITLDTGTNYNVKKDITSDWTWIDFITNSFELDSQRDFIELTINLFMFGGGDLFIDRVEFWEY